VSPKERKGRIFNIQRFSIHDGPGIRTTVFLKGCALKCFWCHNPESLSPQNQLQFFPERCIGCLRCVRLCQSGATTVDNGQMSFNRVLCARCGACVSECYSEARVMTGYELTVAETMKEIASDLSFYEASGGGVTLSGGEPLLQPDFVAEVLKASRKLRLHTAVDTSGFVSWSAFEKVLPHTSLFLFDIKTMNEAQHRSATGQSNEIILSNLQQLSQSGAEIFIRVPVIPGVNDSDEEFEAIGRYVRSLNGVKRLELMPFHGLAKGKYHSLGLNYRAENLEPLKEERLEELASIVRSFQIETQIG
jgi:pyruvate formate lyase activating enzyme